VISSSFTLNEIRDTPNALKRVIGELPRIREIADTIVNRGINRLFLSGCGSSFYAAMTGHYVLVDTKINALALPSSELLFYYTDAINSSSAVIALSRSGRTSETLAALRKAKEKGALTIGITCSKDSPLEREAHHSLLLSIGEEQSIVMTKSFSSLALSTILLCGEVKRSIGKELESNWIPENLPLAASNILKLENKVREIASELLDKRTFIFLGTGSAYPIALEGALKLMETSYVVTKALHSLEFRHGPIAAVDKNVGLIIIAHKGKSSSALINLIRDLKAQKLVPIVISNIEELEKDIEIPLDVNEALLPPVVIIPLQLMAYYVSTLKGLNPDKPRRLSKFVGRF